MAGSTTVSADGTPLSLRTWGAGPPVLLVHGTSGDSAGWAMAAQHLAPAWSVHAMDRRGRGRSGEGPDYTAEREFDDVVAAVEHLADPVHVVGHSWGAICALGAARRTDRIRSLVLYEPPLESQAAGEFGALADRCEALVAADDRMGALAAFYAAIDHERELGFITRVPPAREQMLRDAHTIAREIRAANSVSLAQLDLDSITVPTLVLVGADSPPVFTNVAARLAQGLPNAELEQLPGQRHLAHVFAPEPFARAVQSFIGRHS